MIITSRAATTGTTKFKFESMMRIVSSAVSSGKSREGAIVPVTTKVFVEAHKQHTYTHTQTHAHTKRFKEREREIEKKRDIEKERESPSFDISRLNRQCNVDYFVFRNSKSKSIFYFEHYFC